MLFQRSTMYIYKIAKKRAATAQEKKLRLNGIFSRQKTNKLWFILIPNSMEKEEEEAIARYTQAALVILLFCFISRLLTAVCFVYIFFAPRWRSYIMWFCSKVANNYNEELMRRKKRLPREPNDEKKLVKRTNLSGRVICLSVCSGCDAHSQDIDDHYYYYFSFRARWHLYSFFSFSREMYSCRVYNKK